MFCKTLKTAYVASAGCLTVALGLASAMVHGGDTPNSTPPAASTATAPANAAKDGVTFTHESLGSVLEEMGYEVERFAYASGNLYYRVAYSEQQYSGNFWIELSPNQKFIWLSTGFKEIPKDRRVPYDVLIAILSVNNSTEYFRMENHPDGSMNLGLKSYLPNHRVTRTMLRDQIKDFTAAIDKNGNLWDQSKWTTATEVAKQVIPAVPGDSQK